MLKFKIFSENFKENFKCKWFLVVLFQAQKLIPINNQKWTIYSIDFFLPMKKSIFDFNQLKIGITTQNLRFLPLNALADSWKYWMQSIEIL